MANVNQSAPADLGRLPQTARMVGLAGLALCALGFFMDPAQFFRSYLLGFLFWSGLSVGSLGILMLHHLTGGAWGLMIRRVLESAAAALPLMALLFVPLAFGLPHLYPWARPEALAASELLRHKAPYLNVPFFLARVAVYFIVWAGLTALLRRGSAEQDRTGDPRATDRLQTISGPGMVLFVLTTTFAAVDWVMSLEPEWFSTIFGVLLMGGQAISAMAFAIVMAAALARRGPLAGVLTPSHLHDLGKLLFAFVLLWAYFAFSQYLIIWSGNLPEEVSWYVHRLHGGWRAVALTLVVAHFALPFLLLLSRDVKRDARRLAGVAVLLLVMRLVDLFWLIGPAFHRAGLRAHWLDLAAPAGLGGIWLMMFCRQLGGRPLLPARDPEWAEALEVGKH